MFPLYAATVALSAALVLIVQPLCTRMLLPALGGTPAVWATCLVFFQAGLLAGYVYAHILPSRLPRAHALIHVLLLAGPIALLPVVLEQPASPPEWPILWLLTHLLVGVGLPYVLASSTAPLLQRWFATQTANPYVLYAASNLGSFVGVLAYPLVVEPNLSLTEQADAWRWGYIGLVALTTACALLALRSSSLPPPAQLATGAPDQGIAWSTRLRWLLLALAPSSLMLSVTQHLTTDIAPIPLLWLLPLSLYLLTFALVFAPRALIPHWVLVRWQPAVLIVLMLLLLREASEPFGTVLGLHVAGFFWIAMVCHGELARSRPPPTRLTEFYLWLAVGGVLGGTFNALVAPHVFSSFAEYPIMLVVAAWLRRDMMPPTLDRDADPPLSPFRQLVFRATPALLLGLATAALVLLARRYGEGDSTAAVLAYAAPLIVCFTFQSNPTTFALAMAAVFVASTLDPGVHGPAAYRTRSFFGVHRVTTRDGMRRLVHGNIEHGKQFLDAAKRRIPLAYYHPTSPIGELLTALKGDERLERVGLVGLGAGALAAYAQPGERWTFFEIDPAVIHIARDSGLFTYLRDSKGKIDIVQGDARLTLAASEEAFGVLVIDAFGSDAIPIHLLTREAIDLYRRRLAANGVLAFHISNRYVDLEPVLANYAADEGLECYLGEDVSTGAIRRHLGKAPSIWLFMAAKREDLGAMTFPLAAAAPDERLRIWTDDYSNLLPVLRLFSGEP